MTDSDGFSEICRANDRAVEGFAGLCKLSLHTRWILPKLQNGQVYVLRSSQRVKKGSYDRQKPGGDVHAQYHLKKESHRA